MWEIDGEEFYSCPKGLVTVESRLWINWYQHYKNNLLPVSGGVLDQSAKFLDAMLIIESTKARV